MSRPGLPLIRNATHRPLIPDRGFAVPANLFCRRQIRQVRSVPLSRVYYLQTGRSPGGKQFSIWIYGAAQLRDIVSRHLGKSPKPHLFGVTTGIRFNSSHSANVALYAMTRHCDLGVDIEKIRLLEDTHQIADRFFCPEEAQELLGLPRAEQESAFFDCWTRKEAYIKAVGNGLSMPLNGFRVTIKPGDPGEFVHLGNYPQGAREWTLQNIAIAPGYAAAVAYRDSVRSLRFAPFMTATEILALSGAR
jgi:phosphopantetheine--protein transferase-like protein